MTCHLRDSFPRFPRFHRSCRAEADRTAVVLSRAEHEAEEDRLAVIRLEQELLRACRDPGYVDDADIPEPVRALLRRGHEHPDKAHGSAS